MPSFLALTAMNPLSVYFCYMPNDPSSTRNRKQLSLVVLEVHNTFSERHLYVLQVGVNQAVKPQSGYQHQWTFPRSFHVSPFNDRSGFYKVCLTDPFAVTPPNLKLKVTLITHSGEKKLFASLASTSAVPLTYPNLILALLCYPFSLTLTTLRILYQSFFVHFGRPRLDVFPRPEPHHNSLSLYKGPNPPEQDGQAGSVGWQRPDRLSRWAKNQVIAHLQKRVDELAAHISASPASDQHESDSDLSDTSQNHSHPPSKLLPIKVSLRPTDPLEPVITISPSSSPAQTEELVVTYASPRFFVDLLLHPTPSLALLIGGYTEARWQVSSAASFLRLLNTSAGASLPFAGPAHSVVSSAITKIRMERVKWAVSFVPETVRKEKSKRTSWVRPPFYLPIDLRGFQPRGFGDANLMVLIIVASAYFEDRLGHFLNWLARVRYVPGREPWGDWSRAVVLKQQQGEGYKTKMAAGADKVDQSSHCH